MKRKQLAIWSILLCTLMTVQTKHLKAQAPIQNGGSDYNNNLYHKRNIGVGSADKPEARVHIFNGLTNLFEPEARTARPFLITGLNTYIVGTLPNGTVVYDNEEKDYFTVSKTGFVGIDVLDPLTKLHLHKGIFTISDGSLNEPTRWEVSGTQKSFAIKDYNASEFRFWINKTNGFVGIGITDPDEKLHVNGGIIKVETGFGSTRIGSLNGGFSHFYTTLPKYYFNKSIYVDGGISSYNTLDLNLQTDGTTRMSVKTNGQVDIGAQNIASGTHTDYKLSVDGKIVSKKVVVTLDNWADNVFDEDYKLKTLEEVEDYISKEKHLPEIPSETEVLEEGVELGEINMLLLKKVEELTLYLIQMQKEIDELKSK